MKSSLCDWVECRLKITWFLISTGYKFDVFLFYIFSFLHPAVVSNIVVACSNNFISNHKAPCDIVNGQWCNSTEVRLQKHFPAIVRFIIILLKNLAFQQHPHTSLPMQFWSQDLTSKLKYKWTLIPEGKSFCTYKRITYWTKWNGKAKIGIWIIVMFMNS